MARLSARATDCAWFGDLPRYTPSLALLCHFGMLLPEASSSFRTYVGHPKGWKCLRTVGESLPANTWFATFPVTLLGVEFRASFASLRAYGQRFDEMTSGHFDSAWSSIVVVWSWRSLIRFSAMPFWKCALTPQ